MVGIVAFGAYVPYLRLQRASLVALHAWFAPGLKAHAAGERAAANWDEDSLTMAVEASRDCLAGRDRTTVGSLIFASTTAPFADRQNAGIVKEALVLPDDIGSLDVGGSLRAGTSALIQALNSARATGTNLLTVASEHRMARPASEAELVNGDAAAALLVGPDEVVARFIGAHSVTVDFVDHFRSSGSTYDYAWESRWVRDEGFAKLIGGALATALEKYAMSPEDVDQLIVPVAVRGVPQGIAKRAGIRSEALCDTLCHDIGHSGAAHPLLMLAAALEGARPGERIVVVGFGQGCDILIFEVTNLIDQVRPAMGVSGWRTRKSIETNYLRFLSFTGNLLLDRGMRAEADQKQPLTTLYRNRKAVLGLVGGRCIRTGTVQFPRTDISVGEDHLVGTQEDYPLAERMARIMTYTADSLTYSPSPPSYYGAIEFEGGGRLTAEFTDVSSSDAIAVGRPVRMAFRIKSFDELRDFKRYFWKAVPIEPADEETSNV
jgi:hydroxymethylglutaryl-CoA synthase